MNGLKITSIIGACLFLAAAFSVMLMEHFALKKVRSYSSADEAYKKRPYGWISNVFMVIALVLTMAYMHLDLDVNDQLTNNVPRWESIGFMLGNLFNIDWAYLIGAQQYTFQQGVIYQLLQTFGIAFLGTFVAAILALPFGLFSSHKLFGKWAWPAEILLICIRTFPELLFGIILVSLTGINSFTGILVLGIHSIGMIGKLYSEQVDEISMEPLEAMNASGANAIQRTKLAVLPQVRPNFLSVAIYRLDINLRTATILGVVVGDKCGIGFSLSYLANESQWSRLGSCVLGIVILVVAVDALSSYLRKKLI